MNFLSDLLTPSRTVCRTTGVSKKRLFQTLAGIIAEDRDGIESAEIFTHLVAREKLGSTGLGQGIAIPHCRLASCDRPMGTLVSLDDGIDFEAPDGQPVDLLFVLLVPGEASQEHLDILAGLARLFSQPAFCTALRAADSDAALHQVATSWQD